jgi:Transposase DDE domain group 1
VGALFAAVTSHDLGQFALPVSSLRLPIPPPPHSKNLGPSVRQNLAALRGYTETRHKAKSWDRERRAVARIEATTLGLDIRFVVTNLDVGSAEWIYDSLYCARGQAENLIKLHKTQLASDRTSCRSALANQVRLVLHTAAYWLMLTVRDAIPKAREIGHCRVRDATSSSLENRRPGRRDHEPHSPRVRRGMSRS